MTLKVNFLFFARDLNAMIRSSLNDSLKRIAILKCGVTSHVVSMKNPHRKKKIFVLLILVSLSYLYLYPHAANENLELARAAEAKVRGLKTVQLMTRMFVGVKWLEHHGEFPFRNCPEKRCFAFMPFPNEQKPYEHADAVLLHGPNVFHTRWRYNSPRIPEQLWAYYSIEPPKRTVCSSFYDVKDLDDWFNFSITYHPQSSLNSHYRTFDTWESITAFPEYIEKYEKFKKNKGNRL
jgi:hypothetical protein